MRKTCWLEAQKDFTYQRRPSRVAGEVFQELIPIAAQLVHKKLAKRTAAPPLLAQPPAEAQDVSVVDGDVASEDVSDVPADEAAPLVESPAPSPEPVEQQGSTPEDAAPHVAQPMTLGRRRGKKNLTSGDAD